MCLILCINIRKVMHCIEGEQHKTLYSSKVGDHLDLLDLERLDSSLFGVKFELSSTMRSLILLDAERVPECELVGVVLILLTGIKLLEGTKIKAVVLCLYSCFPRNKSVPKLLQNLH